MKQFNPARFPSYPVARFGVTVLQSNFEVLPCNVFVGNCIQVDLTRISQSVLCTCAQSESNVKKIVVSHPDNGVNHYGLTDVGKKQAVEVSMYSLVSVWMCTGGDVAQ